MAETQDIWTFLETYSVVQGFLMGLYALIILKRSYLSALIFAITLLILAHLYYHFKWYSIHPQFIFTEAPLWYIIGPLFYFFTLKLFNGKIVWYQLLHFVPLAVFVIFMAPFYTEPIQVKVALFDSLFGRENYEIDINRYLFTAHFFLYILVSYLTFKKKSRQLREISSNSTLILDSTVLYSLVYYLIFSLLGFLIYVLIGNDYDLSKIYYGFYYLGLSVLIHFIFYFSIYRTTDEKDLDGLLHNGNKQGKYHSSSLKESSLDEITQHVINYVSHFDVYSNPEIRLRMVADELGIPAHHISQAINQKIGKTFFDLINEQRIEGLKKNINDDKFKNYTLFGIASEHGFKSSSSFYRIFKKYTGKTPKEYFGEFHS